MRVIVVSDSHGATGRLSTILTVAEQAGPIDAIIHLGDGYYDLRDLEVDLPPVYQVAGNCDLFRSDTLDFVTLSNARILLTHGHYQHVREGTDDLLSLALMVQYIPTTVFVEKKLLIPLISEVIIPSKSMFATVISSWQLLMACICL